MVRYPKEFLDSVIARAKEASPNECRGVISGVRTRRGIEVVALHEFESAPIEDDDLGQGPESSGGLLLKTCHQQRLMDRLEAAGTPVVCIFKSSVGAMNDLEGEDDAWMALRDGVPAYPGVEYLQLNLEKRGSPSARAFSWNGKAFVGRDLKLGGK